MFQLELHDPTLQTNSSKPSPDRKEETHPSKAQIWGRGVRRRVKSDKEQLGELRANMCPTSPSRSQCRTRGSRRPGEGVTGAAITHNAPFNRDIKMATFTLHMDATLLHSHNAGNLFPEHESMN